MNVPLSDYVNVQMETCLEPEQCKIVKSFLVALVDAREKAHISASKFIRFYRKEINGGYYKKTGRLENVTK